MDITASLTDRFWAKVNKSGDCWLWKGGQTKRGYGVVSIGGRNQGAHRVAYAIAHGPFPETMHVCHHCDTPACVNPDHLFLGTRSDNMVDMHRKGRARLGGPPPMPGMAHPGAKLTDDQVRAIRAKYRSGGYTHVALSKEYGVHATIIGEILRGLRWRHVDAGAVTMTDGRIAS